jgi:hypothetical protein
MPDLTIERAIVLMAWCALVVGAFVAAFNSAVATAAGAVPECVVPSKLGVSLVLDDSSSMVYNDPSDLRGAPAGIGTDTLPDGSLVSGSKFSDVATRMFDPTALDAANRPVLKQAIAAGLQSSGDTDYCHSRAVRAAYDDPRHRRSRRVRSRHRHRARSRALTAMAQRLWLTASMLLPSGSSTKAA